MPSLWSPGRAWSGRARDNYPRTGNVYTFVAGFCEVEVDADTGEVDMKRYEVVADCGTVMNPRSLGAQLHGGGVQGFGMARSQKWVFDPRWGIPFAHRFYTARPPGILDVPSEMKWAAVELPDTNNPVGSKASASRRSRPGPQRCCAPFRTHSANSSSSALPC